MDTIEFLRIFLPALRKALDSSDIWKGPEYYVNTNDLSKIEQYLDSSTELRVWLDFIDCFFDAKAHNFREAIDGVTMNAGQELLDASIELLRDNNNNNISEIMTEFKNRLASIKATNIN